MTRTLPALLTAAAIALAAAAPAHALNLVPDSQSVQGSQCVGPDCSGTESFGLEPLKLKANNTRLLFDDTSVAAGAPSNDWQLTANDSSQGGSNRFSIEDVTASRTPFTLLAGAPNNSLFVASTGKVGFGTSNPGMALQATNTDTPGVRFEQTGAGGFTPQTWDVAGNEANFFIRDATGGSRLPFRIRPGAPTSSIDISADGDTGFGTQSPESSLHVKRADGSARLEVEEAAGTEERRVLADLVNNGAPLLRFRNTAPDAPNWIAGPTGMGFEIAPEGGTGALTVRSAAVSSAGALQAGADPAATEATQPVDRAQVLDQVRRLPISTWRYSGDSARHIGPSGADFRAAFGVGSSDGFISPNDQSAVALVAVGALSDRVDAIAAGVPPSEADAITELRKSNAKLSKRLKAVERKLRKVSRRKKR